MGYISIWSRHCWPSPQFSPFVHAHNVGRTHLGLRLCQWIAVFPLGVKPGYRKWPSLRDCPSPQPLSLLSRYSPYIWSSISQVCSHLHPPFHPATSFYLSPISILFPLCVSLRCFSFAEVVFACFHESVGATWMWHNSIIIQNIYFEFPWQMYSW